MGCSVAMVFSCLGAAYGIAKSSIGISAVSVLRPDMMVRSKSHTSLLTLHILLPYLCHRPLSFSPIPNECLKTKRSLLTPRSYASHPLWCSRNLRSRCFGNHHDLAEGEISLAHQLSTACCWDLRWTELSRCRLLHWDRWRRRCQRHRTTA